jgi:GLPGLI family protein
MMKIFSFLFLFFCISINSQIGFNVVYEADYKLSYKSQIKRSVVQEASFSLLINDKESYYKNMNKYIGDSLRVEGKLADNSPINEHMKYTTEFPENIGITKGKIYVTIPIFGKKFKYEELNNINWELVNEFKIIAKYKCQKAIAHKYGRTWSAYFTTDIPLPFGPYKFNGLPGLILEISDDKGDYLFSMYSFRKRKYYCKSANIYPNAILVNKNRVFDYRRRELLNTEMIDKYIEDPEVRASLIKKGAEKAKNYNPMELKVE